MGELESLIVSLHAEFDTEEQNVMPQIGMCHCRKNSRISSSYDLSKSGWGWKVRM